MCLRYIFNIEEKAACSYATISIPQLMKTPIIFETGILLECYPCVNKRGWGKILPERKADI